MIAIDVKNVVYAASRRFGITAAKRWALRQRLLILAYHGVVADEVYSERYYPLHISVTEFRRQLELLCRYFKPISPEDVVDWIGGNKSLPERSVLVTFDDGYRNNLVNAVPELMKYGVPAQIAIATGFVGKERLLWTALMRERIVGWPAEILPMPNGMKDIRMPTLIGARQKLANDVVSYCKTLDSEKRKEYMDLIGEEWTPRLEGWHRQMFEFLSWEEVRGLHDRGFTIGAHTVEHEILTRISSASVDKELRESKEAIEREIKAKCCWITYPNGGTMDVDMRIARQARATGFSVGLTLRGTINSAAPCPMMLDRICIAEKADRATFEVYTSGLIKNLHGHNSVQKHDVADCAGCSDLVGCRFSSKR